MEIPLLKDLITLSEELPSREKLTHLINSVLNAAERCGGITHRLLGFARHMEVQWETIDLDALLREVLEFLGKEASYRDIHIEFKHRDPPPRIVSDRGQLQQVFLNIINNAFAAVEDGGRIEIWGRLVPGAVGMVEIVIADSGIGIDPADLEMIFEKFYRVDSADLHSTGSVKFKGAGPGLGLPIAKGVIEGHGGRIWAESEGHDEETCPGSRFHSRLFTRLGAFDQGAPDSADLPWHPAGSRLGGPAVSGSGGVRRAYQE